MLDTINGKMVTGTVEITLTIPYLYSRNMFNKVYSRLHYLLFKDSNSIQMKVNEHALRNVIKSNTLTTNYSNNITCLPTAVY